MPLRWTFHESEWHLFVMYSMQNQPNSSLQFHQLYTFQAKSCICRDTKLKNRKCLTTNILISIQTCILLRRCCAKMWKNLEWLSWYKRWNVNLYHCIFIVNTVMTVLVLSVCAFKLWASMCFAMVGVILLTLLTWKLQCCKSSHLPWVTWAGGRSRTCHPCLSVFFFPARLYCLWFYQWNSKRYWFTVIMLRGLPRKLQGNSQ